MQKEDHTRSSRSASISYENARNWALTTMPRGEADRRIPHRVVDLDAPVALSLTSRAYPGSHEAGAELDALDAIGMVP